MPTKWGPLSAKALKLEPANAALRIYGSVEQGEPLLAELRLGTIAAGVLYAEVPGRDAVYGLEADVAQDVPVSLEAFRNRFVSQEDEAGDAEQDEPTETGPRGGRVEAASAERPHRVVERQ